jgi:hypothetical protein
VALPRPTDHVRDAIIPPVKTIGRQGSRTRDFCIALCSVMGLVLVWSRFANLGTSFWSDEAYSAFYYSNRGPHGIWFGTYVPNNHVLYELLSWVTTGAIGRFEASYRIWSVVPGAAAVVLAAWWIWKRIGPIAGTAVVVLATVSPVHLVLTPQARGYGLAMFAGVVMLLGAVRAGETKATRDVVLFAVGAVIGIWTLPVFALAAIGQAGVLLWDKTLRKRALLTCLVIAVLSIVWYSPMLGGIFDSASQQFGTRLAVVGTVTGVYHHLAAPTISNAMPFPLHSTLNEVATFFVIALLTIAAVVRLWKRDERVLLANLLVPIFFTYLVLVIGKFYVQPRFASYLLFHVIVFLAIGVQQWWDIVARTYVLKAIVAIAITVVAIVGCSRVASLTEAQAKVPWENEKFVAELAKATGLNYVFTDSTHPGALYYYMGENHVVAMHASAVQKQSYCAVKSRFIFVDDQYHQVVSPNIKCLTDRKAVKIEVPQQLYPPIRRPGAVTVYLVPAAKHNKHKPKAKAKAKVHATTTTRPS